MVNIEKEKGSVRGGIDWDGVQNLVQGGTGFFEACRLSREGGITKEVKPRNDVDLLGKGLALVAGDWIGSREMEVDSPLLSSLRRIYGLKRGVGSRVERPYGLLRERLRAWAGRSALPSGNGLFDIPLREMKRAWSAADGDEQRRHFFNLFVARGMSPSTAEVLVENMIF